MTRGLHPPDTLSADEVQTLRGVRRDIYYHGLIGGGLGLCSGGVLVTGAQWAKKLGFVKGTNLNRNTTMLTILSSFAFGTFFAASTTGKELVHMLHPLFQAGSFSSSSSENNDNDDDNNRLGIMYNNDDPLSSSLLPQRVNYQTKILLASSNNKTHDEDEIKLDPQKLREMRTVRRESLMESLHQRGHGLSDSHSGRWVEENSETKFEKE